MIPWVTQKIKRLLWGRGVSGFNGLSSYNAPQGHSESQGGLIGWAWGVVSFFLLIVGFSDLFFVCLHVCACLHECEHMWERVRL